MGYVITSEKSGTGSRTGLGTVLDIWIAVVWASAEIALIREKEHVVLSKDVSLLDTKSLAS